MAELCPTLYDTIDCSLPGSSVPGIFQEYWSELPLPSPEDLLNPGIELMAPALAGGFFTAEPPGKPIPFVKSKSIYKTYYIPQFDGMKTDCSESMEFCVPKLLLWTECLCPHKIRVLKS